MTLVLLMMHWVYISNTYHPSEGTPLLPALPGVKPLAVKGPCRILAEAVLLSYPF